MKQFLNENVNVIANVKNLGDEFLQVIEQKSKSCRYERQFKHNKVKQIGLQVYKDYYTCLAIVYPDASGECVWLDLGSFCNIGRDTCYLDLGRYNIKEVTQEVRTLLNDKYEIAYNLEEDEIEEATAPVDMDLLDDLLGDRDLLEVI